MDGELHDKFQYVAAYEGRCMSGQVLITEVKKPVRIDYENV